MTWSIAEAEECRRAAKQSDRVVQIGLQHVSTGAFIDAKQWVNDGLVGKVTHVQSWMSRNTPRGQGQGVRKVPADCTAPTSTGISSSGAPEPAVRCVPVHQLASLLGGEG